MTKKYDPSQDDFNDADIDAAHLAAAITYLAQWKLKYYSYCDAVFDSKADIMPAPFDMWLNAFDSRECMYFKVLELI